MPASTEAAVLPDASITEHINGLHRQAVKSLGTAILFALDAGRLLTEQKAALGHGSFRQWCDVQLTFTARTAARYMQAWSTLQSRFPAIAGRLQGPDIKWDTVSHLPESATDALGEAGIEFAVLPSVRQLTGEIRSAPKPPAVKPPQIPPDDSQDAATPPEAEIPVRLPTACPVAKDALRPKVKTTLAHGRAALESLMRDLNAIKSRLEQIAKETDWLAFEHVQSLGLGLDNVRRQIRAAAPHAPCHHCNQSGRGCRICKPTGGSRGLGWLPRSRFELGPKDVESKGVKDNG